VAEHHAGLAVERGLTLFVGFFFNGLRITCGECGDTPGRLLVSRGFSYYVASREEALEGSGVPVFAPGGDRVSSAILYAAIVAIWAGVLIPRWLKRSSASPVVSDASGVSEVSEVSEQPAEEGSAGVASEPPAGRRQRRAGDVRRPPDSGSLGSAGLDTGRRRVLAARRRLLGLLVLLAAAAGALAYTRMAAWWVVVPPSVMLLGYLPLLRAASKVDAERRDLAARYQASQRVDDSRSGSGSGSGSGSRSRDVGERVAPVAHVTPVRLAVPADVVDAMTEDEIYDQYTDAKLRAVGD
jgi:hypothetical protein